MMYIIIGIACLVGIIVVVLLLPNSGKQQQKGQKYRFELIKHMDSEIHNSMITHCNLTPPQRKTHV